ERIEEAVEERLPRRARLSAGRIAWIIIGSLIALVAIAIAAALLYLARNSEWVAGELTRVLNQALAQQSNLVLEVRDIEGNPFQQVRLIRPRLLLRGRESRPLLEAPSMTVAYTPWSLWLGRRRSIEITVDRPFLSLARGPDGKLVLPEWRAGRAHAPGRRELEILLHLRNGTVRAPDTAFDVAGLDLDARAITGGKPEVTLQRMTWARGPYRSQLQSLTGALSVSDSIRVQLEVSTPDLAGRARVAWRAQAPGARFRTLKLAHVEV